jgi:hypothetical protein
LGTVQSTPQHARGFWHDHATGLITPEVLGVESISREETVLRVVARVRPLEQWRVARELRGRIHAGLIESIQIESLQPVQPN